MNLKLHGALRGLLLLRLRWRLGVWVLKDFCPVSLHIFRQLKVPLDVVVERVSIVRVIVLLVVVKDLRIAREVVVLCELVEIVCHFFINVAQRINSRK